MTRDSVTYADTTAIHEKKRLIVLPTSYHSSEKQESRMHSWQERICRSKDTNWWCYPNTSADDTQKTAYVSLTLPGDGKRPWSATNRLMDA